MKALFYLHFYDPEPCAAAIRLKYFVEAAKTKGFTCTVIAPRPNYPYGKFFPASSVLNNMSDQVEIRNLPIFLPNSPSVLKRFFSYLSYSIYSFFFLLKLSSVFDVIVSSSPPIFTAAAAALFGKIKRKPFVLDLRDIWPDIGIEIGILKSPLVIFLLRKIEMFILKSADLITVTARGDKDNITSKDINSENIEIVFNGVDVEKFLPASPSEKKKLREKYSIPRNRKVLIYFGSFNHGMNDIKTLGDSLCQLTDMKEDIYMIAVGEGENRDEFISKISGKLEFTHYLSADHNVLPELIRMADLSLVPRKAIESDTGGNIPVKCFESWASGVPVLLSNIPGSEIAEIFSKSNSGKLIDAGSSVIFAAGIKELLYQENLSQLGLNGRNFVVENFDRKIQSAKFADLMVARIN